MSAPGYSNYVESHFERLGKLPSHWDIVALKRVATLTYGDALATDIRVEGGQIAVFGSNGPVGLHDEPNTEAPVIFIGRKGSCGALNWSDVAGFAIDTVYFVDRRTSRVSLRWLFWLLHTLGLQHSSQDTGVPGLARETAHAARVPWPPPSEQAAIAAFLDRETSKIDALVKAQQRLIELLKEKRQAVISHAVTRGLDPAVPMKHSGVEALGEVPAHWDVQLLRRSFSQVDYGISDSLAAEGDVAVLRMGNIVGGELILEDLKYVAVVDDTLLLRKDDLLFNRTNSLDQIGKVGLMMKRPDFPVTFASYLVRLRLLGCCSTKFFSFLLNSKEVLGQARSRAFVAIGQCNLNPTRYGEIEAALPPTSEQADIATYLETEALQVDQLRAEANAAISLLQERRSALISAAVTGKIDVRGLVIEQDEAA